MSKSLLAVLSLVISVVTLEAQESRLLTPALEDLVPGTAAQEAQPGPIQFLKDGKTLAISWADSAPRLQLWDVENADSISAPVTMGYLPAPLQITPDGKFLYSPKSRQWCRVDLTAKEKKLFPLKKPLLKLDHPAVITPDGRKFVIAVGDYLEVGSPETGKRQRFAMLGGPLRSLAISPDNRTIAVGAGSTFLILYDLETGKEIDRFGRTSSYFVSVAFSPSGKKLAGVDWQQNELVMWSLRSGKRVGEVRLSGNSFLSRIRFLTDKQCLLVPHNQRTIQLWNSEAPNKLKAIQLHDKRIQDFTVSPDAKLLATMHADVRVRVWSFGDLIAGRVKCLKKFNPFPRPVIEPIPEPGVPVSPMSVQGESLPDGAVQRFGKPRFRFHKRPDQIGFLHDGKTMMLVFRRTGRRELHFELWDVKEWRKVSEQNVRDWGETTVVLSPDGRFLVGYDKEIVTSLWEVRFHEGKPKLQAVDSLTEKIGFPFSFTADSKALVSAREKAIFAHDTTSWKRKKILSAPRGCHSITLSPDRRLIAMGNYGGSASLVEVKTGKVLDDLGDIPRIISQARFSPSGQFLLEADSGTGRLWNVKNRKKVTSFHMIKQGNVRFLVGDRVLIADPEEARISVWDPGKDRWYVRKTPSDGPIHDVAVSPDRKMFATLHRNRVRLWDAVTGDPSNPNPQDQGSIIAMTASADGKSLVSVSDDGHVIFRDATSGKRQRAFRVSSHSIARAAFSPDVRLLGTVDVKGTVSLWDIRIGRKVRDLYDGKALNPAPVICFTPDEKLVVATDQKVYVWNRTADRVVQKLALSRDSTQLTGVAVSPDGRYLALTGTGPTLEVWDLTTKERLVGTWGKSKSKSAVVCFTTNGQTLARVDDQGIVELWELATGKKSARWETQLRDCQDARFIPGTRLLALTGTRRAIQLWDWLTEERLAGLWGHEDLITCLVPAPAGHVLMSGSVDETILLWDLTRLKSKLPRLSLHAEWQNVSWKALTSANAKKAREGMRDLARDPEATVKFLRAKLTKIREVTKPEEKLRSRRAVHLLESLHTTSANRLIEELAQQSSSPTLKALAVTATKHVHAQQQAQLQALLR